MSHAIIIIIIIIIMIKLFTVGEAKVFLANITAN